MFPKYVSHGRTVLITKGPKKSKCPNSESPQHRLDIITNKLIHTVLFFRFTLILSYPIHLGPAIWSFPSPVPTKILYVLLTSTLPYYMIRHPWELLWTYRSNSICHECNFWKVSLCNSLLPPTPSPILCWNKSIGLSTLLPNALLCGIQHKEYKNINIIDYDTDKTDNSIWNRCPSQDLPVFSNPYRLDQTMCKNLTV